MKDDAKKLVASDILVDNMKLVTTELLQTVYHSVEEISRQEALFEEFARRLTSINANLTNHLLKNKWLQGADQKKCLEKIKQSKDLIKIIDNYILICQSTIELYIKTTEKFEAKPNLKEMVTDYIHLVEEKMKRLKEDQEDIDATD